MLYEDENHPWVKEHQAGNYWEHPEFMEDVPWLRERPPEIQALIRRFPPWCLVVAKRFLLIPGPDAVGIVAGFLNKRGRGWERDNGPYVQVSQLILKADARASCLPEWLEVVGFWKGLDFAAIDALLSKGAS